MRPQGSAFRMQRRSGGRLIGRRRKHRPRHRTLDDSRRFFCTFCVTFITVSEIWASTNWTTRRAKWFLWPYGAGDRNLFFRLAHHGGERKVAARLIEKSKKATEHWRPNTIHRHPVMSLMRLPTVSLEPDCARCARGRASRVLCRQCKGTISLATPACSRRSFNGDVLGQLPSA